MSRPLCIGTRAQSTGEKRHLQAPFGHLKSMGQFTVPTAASAAMLLAVVLCLVLPALAAGAGTVSELWGRNGNAWTPSGRLIDFSYAGYHQGNDPLPNPPETKSVLDFRQHGMSDTQMLQAAIGWANLVPRTEGYTVLYLPKGTYTLTERLTIKNSRVVLRGAGSGKTVLYIPKSLTDLYGPDPSFTGGYVNWGGFITIKGRSNKGKALAWVAGRGNKGDRMVTVTSTRGMRVGAYYDTWWTDIGGKFNSIMIGDNWKAPEKYNNKARTRWTVRILKIQGNVLTLERPLPYPISPGVNRVSFHMRAATVTESGVEGLTFRFKWELYAGHHLERGWNGIELIAVWDCWVRDIELVNPDSGVLLNYQVSAVTVTNIKISYTKTRANNLKNRFGESAAADGHWGLVYSSAYDILFEGFDIRGTLNHDVGTGMGGQFGVFANGRLSDGNLDLHRGLAGPTLYTNINVGLGSKALGSGGPKSGGPNANAGSTWWNIISARPVAPNFSSERPGSCSYGPEINLVGVNLRAEQTRYMCHTWLYERSPRIPPNLYDAQLALRRQGGLTG